MFEFDNEFIHALSSSRVSMKFDFYGGEKWNEAIQELNPDKLPQLIELKYHTVRDAVQELGPVANIRNVFVGFQKSLYWVPLIAVRDVLGFSAAGS